MSRDNYGRLSEYPLAIDRGELDNRATRSDTAVLSYLHLIRILSYIKIPLRFIHGVCSPTHLICFNDV